MQRIGHDPALRQAILMATNFGQQGLDIDYCVRLSHKMREGHFLQMTTILDERKKAHDAEMKRLRGGKGY